MTTPTEIAIYHNRMMPFYWMVAVAVTVMMGGVVFFNWNIAFQVRELRDESNARFNALENRNSDETLTEQQITALIESRAVAAKLMEEK